LEDRFPRVRCRRWLAVAWFYSRDAARHTVNNDARTDLIAAVPA
jgi:hypothetical protein